MATNRKAKVAYLWSQWSDFNNLVSIVGFSGCLSWLNLFSKWLYVKVIVKRSFSRSNLQKMSVWKACRCLIQDLNGLIANYIPIMLTTSFSLSISSIDGVCLPFVSLQIAQCPDSGHLHDIVCQLVEAGMSPRWGWRDLNPQIQLGWIYL